MNTLALVVPCYNEAERLDARRFTEFASASPEVRLVFVDDGSTDATATVLERVRAAVPDRVAVLRLEANGGKAEAVRRGVLHALDGGCCWVGFWDADLATPLDAVATFTAVLEHRPEVEMVVGSRVQLLGRRIARRPARHYLGRAFATAASLVLGLPIYDTQCGAKLFRASGATRALFVEPFATRWLFDVEILARLIRERRRTALPQPESIVYELPLAEWRDVAGSRLRARDFARAVVDLGVVYARYLRPGVRRPVPAGGILPLPSGVRFADPAATSGRIGEGP